MNTLTKTPNIQNVAPERNERLSEKTSSSLLSAIKENPSKENIREILEKLDKNIIKNMGEKNLKQYIIPELLKKFNGNINKVIEKIEEIWNSVENQKKTIAEKVEFILSMRDFIENSHPEILKAA